MTKYQAIELMKQGKKVTHRYISDKEYITMEGYLIITEEGYACPVDVFWLDRRDESWNDGWEEYDPSSAEPDKEAQAIKDLMAEVILLRKANTEFRELMQWYIDTVDLKQFRNRVTYAKFKAALKKHE